MVDFEIWIWLTKKNHDSSYARVKIFGNYLMKSPNKPKNFFFHEMFDVASMHGCCWPAFAYLDWPKWGTKLSFSEWVSKSTTFTTSCPTSLWLSLKTAFLGDLLLCSKLCKNLGQIRDPATRWWCLFVLWHFLSHFS